MICANIYLQKLKSYSADKKNQIGGNYKIQNVQNISIRQKFDNSKSTEATRNQPSQIKLKTQETENSDKVQLRLDNVKKVKSRKLYDDKTN